MDRRRFLNLFWVGATISCSPNNGQDTGGSQAHLAGMSLTDLHGYYERELFDKFLPFWDKHGIDHELGGVLCNMDYDGTLANTEKFVWFQGRAIWVYSFLYNHFRKDPKYLEIARKAKDFLLKHAPLENGWWATSLSRTGRVLKRSAIPDVTAVLFGAEGLQEYAYAARDDYARQMAVQLFKMAFREIERPGFQADSTHPPGVRPQHLWMKGVRIATQILRRWKDPEVSGIAERSVDAIIQKHYNPDIGLNTDALNADFSRPKEEAAKCSIGVSIETLWMVMDEADRRNDKRLWSVCADRIRHHLEVGWDWVFGGLAEWVNVEHGCYQWPPEHPTGTNLVFQGEGEYFYQLKSMWALNEALIATLNVFERRGDRWAGDFFDMMYSLVEQKYSQRKRGLQGYMLFGDRRMNFQEHVSRQDNYHPPRQMMLNLLTIERMLQLKG